MKNQNIKLIAFVALCLGLSLNTNAQTTGQKIGTNPTVKDASALLELEANNKGVLMPRVALTNITDIVTIPSPANALTVFNTATAGSTPNNVLPGYYYWSSPQNKWIRLLDDPAAVAIEPWQVQGTTDKATLNTQNIYQTGTVAIGKNAVLTGAVLDVAGAVRVGTGHKGTVGISSVAFGANNTASGQNSVAMGIATSAIGYNSIAAGYLARADGERSVAIGAYPYTSGDDSFVTGFYTWGSAYAETVIGSHNAITTGTATSNVETDAVFQVGNGVTTLRNNAMTILKNGKTAIGVIGAAAAAKPTELLDLGGTATAGNGGLKIRNINSAAYTGAATDKVVVADASGVLKTINQSALGIEPLQIQGTTNKATANNVPAYLNSNLAVGDFTATTSTKKFEVKGDFKSEVAAGNIIYGTEVNSPLNPASGMHYWMNTATGDYRITSANASATVLEAKTGTTKSIVSAEATQASMASIQDDNSSRSIIRTTNTGNFFMETFNVAGNYGSTISLQNDGLRLVHTTTGGIGNPFPNANRSEILLQKENGVGFDFKDASGNPKANYWFPTTTGTAGQVLTRSAGTGNKTEWSSSVMPKFFYAPSVVIPTHDAAGVPLTGTRTLDIYAVYAQQFGFSGGAGQARSNAASNLPVLPAAGLDYFITYFDTNVFNTVTVSAAGVISYTVKSTAVATEASFMNIVFKVKD